jgi:hypothetical protein
MGAHKTGSTFLQEIFARYSALLGNAGVHYVPRDSFFRNITSRNLQWAADRDACVPVLRGMMRQLLPSRQPGALLLSDEALSGHILGDPMSPSDCFYRDCDRPVDLLKRGLGTRRMAVVFFIRTIGEFLESCYLQRVRLGSTMSFEEYVSGFDIDRISWVPTIEKLRVPLGAEDRIWVYDYRALQEHPLGVLADLFGRMGVSFPSGHRFERRVNESFTPRQYRAVMRFNRIWPAGRFGDSRKQVLKAMSVLRVGARERMRFFSPPLREVLVERHRSDLAAIRAMGGIVEFCPGPAGSVAGGA